MDTKKQWEELYRMLRNKDWTGATKCIDRIIEVEPENPNHYLKKGDICLKAGDKAGSLGAYLKAAWYLNKSGFLKKALAVYKMTLRSDPDNDEAIRSANKIMMELEAPVQPAAQTEWKEVFPPAETQSEKVVISPESGMTEPALYEQTEEVPKLQTEDVLEPTRFSEETTDPSPVSESESRAAVTEAAQGPGPEADPLREMCSAVPPGFLAHFTGDEIGEIIRRAELKRYADGETVVQEGDTGDSIYLIRCGRAMVVGHFFGKVIVLDTLSEGDLFGEVAYLTGRTRTANVVAKGALEVHEINRLLLEELIEKRPQILSQMNEMYVKRVKDTIRKVKAK